MLTPALHWIRAIEPLRLAVTPCPLGFNDLPSQLQAWRKAGVDCVVSLLERHECQFLGVEREQHHCEEAGMRFISFPIPDHGLPRNPVEFESLIEKVANDVAQGSSVAVHCYAGIGRTGMLAAGVLSKLQVPAATVLDSLKDARGYEMPETPAQRQWAETYIRKSRSPI